MKKNAVEILGKRVTGAVLKHSGVGDLSPSSMLILVFDDDLYYEFYSPAGQIKPWRLEVDFTVVRTSEEGRPGNAREFLKNWGEAEFSNKLLAWLDDQGKPQVEVFSG